jgi:hypothetical protein
LFEHDLFVGTGHRPACRGPVSRLGFPLKIRSQSAANRIMLVPEDWLYVPLPRMVAAE